MGRLKPPGPNQDGFAVDVYEMDGSVHLELGVLVKELPLPPSSARGIAKAVLRACQKANPKGNLLIPPPGLSVQRDSGRVLLTLAVPQSHLTLSYSEARGFYLLLADLAAKIDGKPLNFEIT